MTEVQKKFDLSVEMINVGLEDTVGNIAVGEQKHTHPEEHINVGEYLKSTIYGGLDGTVNTLAIILGGIASSTTAYQILTIAVSAILGDAIGMGLGDYLSVKAQQQFILAEEKREHEEVETKNEAERQQIIEIYQGKGYTPEQSLRISQLYATNSQAFVNVMMLEQLGLVVNDNSAIKCGLTTFISFMVFGVIPLIPYIITAGIMKITDQQLVPVIVIGIVEFLCLGIGKALLLSISVWRSGLEILLMGSATVAIGYGVGVAFQT